MYKIYIGNGGVGGTQSRIISCCDGYNHPPINDLDQTIQPVELLVNQVAEIIRIE